MGKELQNATIELFVTWVRQQGKSENTVKTYKGVMKNFAEWLASSQRSLTEITQQDIQKYMDYLADNNRSAATIDKVFATIRVFAQYIDRQDIVKNILKKEKETHIYNTAPKTLTSEEKNLLLQKVKEDNNLRNIAIVYILLCTGIRISELCNLNVTDIESSGHGYRLKVADENGAAARRIPLDEEAVYYLHSYLKERNSKKEALFLSNAKKRLTPRAVQYMLGKYNVTPHVLRHTFCYNLLEKGHNLHYVAELAGHNDINVTKRYQKVNDEKLA